MHINKITNSPQINGLISSVKGNRVFLDSSVDSFTKSNSSQNKNKTVLEKIKNSLNLFDKFKDKKDNIIKSLLNSAEELSEIYKKNVSNIKDDFAKIFGDMESVETISARSKGKNSIYSKLFTKFNKGKLTSTNIVDLVKGIGDGYGIRIILKDLDPSTARQAINNSNMTYEEFIKNIKNFDNLNPDELKQVKKGLNKLKEAQTGEFVNKLIKQIRSGVIELADDEFNNYGSDITSYFSDSQLMKIALAYEEKNKKPLTVVNKLDLNSLLKKGENISKKPNFIETNPEKATKLSGYTTTQANLKTSYTMGEKLADTELQIRGKHVNNFAEIEHVPYDIRQNKITDSKYNEIKTVMRGMSDESYREYSKYLSDTYTYHRLKELGVYTDKPELSKNLKWADIDKLPDDLKNVVNAGEKIDDALLSKITENGLLSLHEKCV